MQSEQLHAHQVVAWGDAGGHGEVVPSTGGVHGVYGPLAAGQTIVRDLEPFLATRASRRGVVDFGEVVLDGT